MSQTLGRRNAALVQSTELDLGLDAAPDVRGRQTCSTLTAPPGKDCARARQDDRQRKPLSFFGLPLARRDGRAVECRAGRRRVPLAPAVPRRRGLAMNDPTAVSPPDTPPPAPTPTPDTPTVSAPLPAHGGR